MVAWKWSFTDKNNNDISLILQHNTRDEEEKMGNAVKLTMWNLLEEESNCFEKKHPEAAGSPNAGFKFDESESIDWNYFIPH
jgi:hypothetical protein